MTTSPFTARPATTTELDAVIDLCVAAFADEAVTAWLLSDVPDRQQYMHQMFGASLGAAIEHGSLIVAIESGGDAVAASVWLPPADGPASSGTASSGAGPADGETHDEDRPADPVVQRLVAVQELTSARAPDAAHLLLSAMAVLPAHRGRGAGSVLTRAGLERARALDLPVYLEASSSDNRRLYERFGFCDHGEPIVLPDGGPCIQPMWLEL